MNIKRFITGTIMLSLVAISCGSADGGPWKPDGAQAMPEPAESNDQAASLTPVVLFQAYENVSTEFESREALGALSGEWSDVWSKTTDLRQQSRVSELIDLIHQQASSEALLAVGPDTIEQYFRSFQPLIGEIEHHFQAGTLDDKLVDLRSHLSDIIEQVSHSDNSKQRAKDYCCVVDYLATSTTGCYGYHTAFIWASAKCSAYGSIPATLWSLHGGKCSNQTKCQ